MENFVEPEHYFSFTSYILMKLFCNLLNFIKSDFKTNQTLLKLNGIF